MYQPVLLHTDPVLSYINPHCPILTKYHQVPTSTASYWPSTTKYQPVPPPTDPLPPSTNQFWPILTWHHHVLTRTAFYCSTQYHQVLTSSALYWPSTIIYQPVPPHTDQVPLSDDQFYPVLTQYDHLLIQMICQNIQMSEFPLSTWDEHSCT